MVFINELVSDIDKGNPLFRRRDPFPPNHDMIQPYLWTVDREKDFILVKVGGNHPEQPDCFVFQWCGILGALEVILDVFQERSAGESFVQDVVWKMQVIYLPDSLDEKRNEAICLLHEAFKAHGRFYGKGPVRSVEVSSEGCGLVVGGGYVTF